MQRASLSPRSPPGSRRWSRRSAPSSTPASFRLCLHTLAGSMAGKTGFLNTTSHGRVGRAATR
eukprot:12182280-Heterocapsa_arctica.AAC.1